MNKKKCTNGLGQLIDMLFVYTEIKSTQLFTGKINQINRFFDQTNPSLSNSVWFDRFGRFFFNFFSHQYQLV